MGKTSTDAFFELVRAGLWEKEVRLSSYGKLDFDEIYRLASEQSVVGLVAAGLEKVVDVKVPQSIALTIAGEVLQLEQRNKAMNQYIAKLWERMKIAGIYSFLLKGQGIAQCYKRPLWRACGDIDLFLDGHNYTKAMLFMSENASVIEDEDPYIQHLGFIVDSWSVEIHGRLRGGLWKKLDDVLDKIQESVLADGKIRTWDNSETCISLPGVDEDLFYTFSHILQHFFKGGIGLRQICDWCRLMWMYRDEIDKNLLKSRLVKAGIWTEWKTFAALSVEVLGIPQETVPFYSNSQKWTRKSEQVLFFILKSGNFGHNRDFTYKADTIALRRKFLEFIYITKDSVTHFLIFPKDSLKVWWSQMKGGLKMLVKRRMK